MRIVFSKAADLPRILKCHRKAFPKALSSKLGDEFGVRMFSWYVNDPRGVMFHIENENEIIGYCGGIVIKQPGLPGAATSITQYSFNTFVKSFLSRPWLIFHPELLKKYYFVIRNLSYKLGVKTRQPAPVIPGGFRTNWSLVVIGTIPEVQGKGVGSFLLQEFERLAKEDGVEQVKLSVKTSNEKAIRAYTRNGWTELSKDETSIIMFKNL